jgi:ribose-phosphate pyrophosphokinase
MITLNGKPVDIGNFPDGTILMKQGKLLGAPTIHWRYENDREFLALIYLVKHLNRLGYDFIDLYMPYIPNARMDRVKHDEDVFTLKYFAELLNSLNFDTVTVLDPHSNVSEALINNLRVLSPKKYINRVLDDIKVRVEELYNPMSFDVQKRCSLTVFFPDEGSMKRYSNSCDLPYAFGVKKRNWETGAIEGLDVEGATDLICGKDILIVDDICSRGGTFYHSAKKLKELGAKDIYLFVSHCEDTVLEGDLLKGDLIKKLYTTDSIFTKSHEKIEVLK